jgi:hypothetical protein
MLDIPRLSVNLLYRNGGTIENRTNKIGTGNLEGFWLAKVHCINDDYV